jgi:2-C-methyl-D-erythritol 4-phosphate cytidylyltransferase
MQSDIPKQYLHLQGRTVLEQTVHRLALVEQLKGIAIAVTTDDPYWAEQQFDIPQRIFRTEGGKERCHSVLNALQTLYSNGAAGNDWVLVHDAARPCVRQSDIELLIEKVSATGQGGLLAVPVHDTMKQADHQQQVKRTIDRSRLWHALTPQMFRLEALHDALVAALDEGYLVTDEASAMEHKGMQPLLVEGHGDNIKITRPEDLALAEFYLQHQEAMTNVMDDGE